MKWMPMIQSVIAMPRNTSSPLSPDTSAMTTMGTDDRIDPKIGIRVIDGRDPREEQRVLDVEEQQADVGEYAVDEADQQLPADDAGQPAIDAGDDAVVVDLVLLGDERAQEVLDADEVDQDERRHHQHQEEAADPGDHGADELLAVLDRAVALAFGGFEPLRQPLLD